MFERRSLKWPITIGVVMIVLVVLLTVGWIVMSAFGKQWLVLTLGALVLLMVLLGVVFYLVVTIKEVSLNRRQTNFMDAVTHELKSPIASLKLYLQTLNLRKVSEEERESFHRYMLEDVERLDELINHLLIAAQLNKAHLPEDRESIELSELLRQCASSVCLRYQAPPETVEFDLQPCVVQARRVDMDVIFRNLIDNAVKYGGSPAHVWIRMKADASGMVHIWVADNGNGVPPHLRQKIFGRFVRLGFELQREKPGTGLGLHIVSTLIRRLRGNISVKGHSQDTGAAFKVSLPGQSLEEAEQGEVEFE